MPQFVRVVFQLHEQVWNTDLWFDVETLLTRVTGFGLDIQIVRDIGVPHWQSYGNCTGTFTGLVHVYGYIVQELNPTEDTTGLAFLTHQG
ncbi:hypothetical protein D3C81_1608900 [compost metagenome]